MEKEIHKVFILPAKFIKYDEQDNSRVWIKMILEDNTIQEKKIPIKAMQNIKNPQYLFVSIMTGKKFMSLGVCDGLNYLNLFNEKWNELL